MVSQPVKFAGNLKNCYKEWIQITDNPLILKWVQGYELPFSQIPVQNQPLLCNNFSNEEKRQITTEIEHLLEIGAVEECTPTVGQFVSRIFLANKSNGTKRFILNLKQLNEYLIAPHFKMEDVRTVMRLIQPGTYLATIDLKEAYYMLPILKNHMKYLRFSFQGCLYQFTCLPFGLSSGPYAFIKIMKPVVQELRSRGILCINYLDDFLLLGSSKQECFENINIAIKLLTSLGFLINLEKSVLFPSQKCKFLGFIFNSISMSIELPENKRQNIVNWIDYFQIHSTYKIKEFAQFIGVLTSACPAVKYGWLYTKLLEREKYLALQRNSNNYETYMTLRSDILPDLNWWRKNITKSYNNLKTDKFDLEIYTDASLSGWGATCNGDSTCGWWTTADQQNHINYLELLAIFYGLKCFCGNLKNANILIRTDNTTALSYINKMGSIRFPKSHCLAKQIWQWCEGKNLWIFASYISSSENTVADKASRTLAPETEWTLNQNAFNLIVSHFGVPEIDLFASLENHKCDKYVSWLRDPGAVEVDAFTMNWGHYFFYAFPPFSLMLRVVQKICNDQASGIVVAPLWKSQSWYPLFQKLCSNEPLIFKPSPNLLISPYSGSSHPLSERLTLVAAKLSGKHLH